jgi:hypothetical protein
MSIDRLLGYIDQRKESLKRDCDPYDEGINGQLTAYDDVLNYIRQQS